ncbi:unnamed protein product [Toxocara canis]|uniref:Glycosyltransferase family 1 protein n=1 Tax=Toxocara canis TaxID=6265 RepID=A0A183U6F3_TOXCA|nr:unnamed protein product [Toxocara canis]
MGAIGNLIPQFEALERGEITIEDFEPLFAHFYQKKIGSFTCRCIHYTYYRMIFTYAVRFLKVEGFKTALLTNNFWPDRAHRMSTLPVRFIDTHVNELFDVVVESCRIGIRKPDSKIYEHTLSLLKVNCKRYF